MNRTSFIDAQLSKADPLEPLSLGFDGQSSIEGLSQGSDTLAALAHDARNLMTALGLYCDLLGEPGVLAPQFAHYRNELRLVASAGRRLVAKIDAKSRRVFGGSTAAQSDHSSIGAVWPTSDPVELSAQAAPAAVGMPSQSLFRTDFGDDFTPAPITSLAAELAASRNLLAALAGPGVAVTVDAEGGRRGVWLTSEDLTRILVNLVRNSADAMPAGGDIHIHLAEINPPGRTDPGAAPARLLLTFDDSGPGIPPEIIGRVFDPGFTTRAAGPAAHSGLGLAIVRSIVESAGGRIDVLNRPQGGARFAIELPAV